MPDKHPTFRPLSEVIAENIRGFRTDLGWSQAELAQAMSRYGFNWTPITVAEVEGKRRRRVNLEELLGLTIVFDTALAHFLLPFDAGNHGSLIEVSPLINLSFVELIHLLGQYFKPQARGQDEPTGLVGDLVRLRRERDRRERQAEDAQRDLERLTTLHLNAMDQVIGQKRRVDDISRKIQEIETAIAESGDDLDEARAAIRHEEQLEASFEADLMRVPLFEADRFQYLIEAALAEELGVPVEKVIKMSLWLWHTPARDEVNRRIEDDEDFEQNHENAWTEMSGRIAHELTQAIRREAETSEVTNSTTT